RQRRPEAPGPGAALAAAAQTPAAAHADEAPHLSQWLRHRATGAAGEVDVFVRAQQTAHIRGDFERPNIKVHETISVAAQSSLEKVAIAAEERGTPQPAQQGDDLIVLHSFASDLESNLRD